MATYRLSLNVVKSKGTVRAGISGAIEGVGATAAKHDMLRNYDEAVPGDVGATLQDIKKKKTCAIIWRPNDVASRSMSFFKDVLAAKEAIDRIIVMVSIEGYPEERAYLTDATVKSVGRDPEDPRMGGELVMLTCPSVEVKRA